MKKKPLVSVIVTTKNEEKNIAHCLESIKKQAYPNIEILVVDNNSSDNTKNIARIYTSHIYNVGIERSVQRNFGAYYAKGEYLLFIDADMALSEDVVKECEKLMKSLNASACIIPEKSIGIGYWAQCKALERSYYEGIDWMEAPRFFRSSIFRSISGYDSNLVSGEDYDLNNRMKALFGPHIRIKSYIFHNEGNLSLCQVIKKKIYYGTFLLRYKTKVGNSHAWIRQSSLISRYKLFFLNHSKVSSTTNVFIGMIIMKTCEFLALGMGIIIGFVKRR